MFGAVALVVLTKEAVRASEDVNVVKADRTVLSLLRIDNPPTEEVKRLAPNFVE